MKYHVYRGIAVLIGLVVSTGSARSESEAPRLKNYDYTSAFVFMFFHKDDRPLYVLLGRQSSGHDKGLYDDFGGRRDSGENHPADTAAREFSEELNSKKTMGLDADDIRSYIGAKKDHTKDVIASHKRVIYMTRFDEDVIKNLKQNFYKDHGMVLAQDHLEKDLLAVVKVEDLMQAIRDSDEDSGVIVKAHIVDPKTGKDKPVEELIQLRKKFVQKLRGLASDAPYTPGRNPKVRFY